MTNTIIKLKYGAPWGLLITYKALDALKQALFALKGMCAVAAQEASHDR
jgi:hypothetical protein